MEKQLSPTAHEDATVEHKDIPEGTEAHGEPTSEQRKDMMRKKAEYWLQPPCHSPCELARQAQGM